jgi:protein-disulfide isomerase
MKRLRAALDLLAAVSMLVAGALIVYHSGWRDREPSLVPAVPVDIGDKNVRGDASASVVLLVFADFLCPYCKTFAQTTQHQIIERYVDTGRVQLAFRHLPLKALHPFAPTAGAAVECAGTQGKFWLAHDLFFEHQDSLDWPTVLKYATSLGLDSARFRVCVDTIGAAGVDDDQKTAGALGIQSTPYFLIGRRDSDGHLRATHVLRGALPFSAFASALDEALTLDAHR